MVPDHWLPIALLARQQGWSSLRTARTAAIAGIGHTASTLVIALIVWTAGALLAVRFGNVIRLLSSAALIGFGAWIALSSWRDLRRESDGHSHFGHAHAHRHDDGLEHRHWHVHHEHDFHNEGNVAVAVHEHTHEASSRTALLLIVGSSATRVFTRNGGPPLVYTPRRYPA